MKNKNLIIGRRIKFCHGSLRKTREIANRKKIIIADNGK